MNRHIRSILVLTAVLFGSSASAVEVSDPWVRATPPGAKLSAGFLTVKADAGTPDRLIAVTSPRAGRVEIHESRMDGEIMRMRALPDGVAVPAEGQVVLAPGGIHLMLLDLPQPLQTGESIALTLSFEVAGEVSVEAQVRHPGEMGDEHQHHH